MDLINNLIFAALNKTVKVTGGTPEEYPELSLRFIRNPFNPKPSPVPSPEGDYFYYEIVPVVQKFCSIEDSEFIEDAIQKHWSDFVDQRDYALDPPTNSKVVSYFKYPPYHLIYAYLVENTRIAQIMEKLIYLYVHDEKLTKATTSDTSQAFQWIVNTENLFFKSLRNTSYRNVTSQVRSSQDAIRRNAYFRMFGMDLAFGDPVSNAPVNFHKAEHNNQPFILLFEKFISEIWQAYINVNNTSGQNTTDLSEIADTANKLEELLMSRRTSIKTFTEYRYWNLSREEYASVVMMSWFYEAISYDSPLVKFLRCNATTPGERLINIGNKVGIPAHSKSEGLLQIAPPMNTLLRRIELGEYSVDANVKEIVESQKNIPNKNDPRRLALDDLLLIINNWEKATGHKIKTQGASLNGTVRVDQNIPRSTLVLN